MKIKILDEVFSTNFKVGSWEQKMPYFDKKEGSASDWPWRSPHFCATLVIKGNFIREIPGSNEGQADSSISVALAYLQALQALQLEIKTWSQVCLRILLAPQKVRVNPISIGALPHEGMMNTPLKRYNQTWHPIQTLPIFCFKSIFCPIIIRQNMDQSRKYWCPHTHTATSHFQSIFCPTPVQQNMD